MIIRKASEKPFRENPQIEKVWEDFFYLWREVRLEPNVFSRKGFSLALLITVLIPLLNSQVLFSAGLGSKGFQILSLRAGAKSESLGGAVTAVGDDLSGYQTNPAAVSQMSACEAYFSQRSLFDDIKFSYLAYAHPTRMGIPSIEYGSLDYGDFDSTDEHRQKIGSQSPKDFYAGIGWSSKKQFFSVPGLTAGASLRYIQADRVIQNANASSFSVGALYLTTYLEGLKLGLALQSLPGTIRFGAGYQGAEWPVFSLKPQYSVDAVFPGTGKNYVSMGTDILFFNLISAQIGLSGEDGIENPFRYGMGIGNDSLQFNYSLSPSENLGNQHHVSLRLRFGKGLWNWFGIFAKSDPENPQSQYTETQPNFFLPPIEIPPIQTIKPETEQPLKKIQSAGKETKHDYDQAIHFLEERKVDEAVRGFKRVLSNNKNHALASSKLLECLKSRGIKHFSNRNYDSAARDFEEALKLNPQDKNIQKFLESALEMISSPRP